MNKYEMKLEEAKKQLEGLIKCMNINNTVNVILYKEDKQAIETILQALKDKDKIINEMLE